MHEVVASRETAMKRLLHAMQTATGATKGEVTVVLLLLIGAILGNVMQRLDAGDRPANTATPTQVRAILETGRVSSLAAETTHVVAEPPIPSVAARKRTSSAGEHRTSTINLNTASKTRLMSIPGVGEATADRILQYRSHTPFTRPEDLRNIKGIGDKRFERMRPFITAP